MKKFWIYAIVAVAIVAVLYFVGKKSKSDAADTEPVNFKQPVSETPDEFKVVNNDTFKAPENSDEAAENDDCIEDIDFCNHRYF